MIAEQAKGHDLSGILSFADSIKLGFAARFVGFFAEVRRDLSRISVLKRMCKTQYRVLAPVRPRDLQSDR